MRYLPAIALLCALSGCDAVGATPDAASVTGALNDSYSQYLGSRGAQGTQFTLQAAKTDGQAIEAAGTPGYRMFVDITVGLPNGFRPECTRPGAPLCILYEGLSPMPGPVTLTYRGNVELSKSETGWRITAVNVDFGAPSATSAPASGN